MDDRRHAAPNIFSGSDIEPAGPHQLDGGAVAPATAGKVAPWAFESVLAGCEESRACTHVLDEQQLPVRSQHAGDFAKCAFRFVDGAQHQRRDDGVHGRISQREVFS